MKKIISLVLVLVLALTAIGGTLAYFTDTDEADNVFTMGRVDITLLEHQRELGEKDGKTDYTNKSEEKLEKFENNKPLLPLTNPSAQGEKDKFGMPTSDNYVDKIIRVQNNEQDAYVAVYVAIPKALVLVYKADLNEDGAEEKYWALHTNDGNHFTADGKYTDATAATLEENYKKEWTRDYAYGETKINGVDHMVYRYVYNNVLGTGDMTSTAAFVGAYLDHTLDYDNDNKWYTIAGGQKLEGIAGPEANEGEVDMANITIPVFAVGTQATGFETGEAAINESFGTKIGDFNPWAE